MGGISNNIQERRVKWHGHVMRREVHYVGRRAVEIKVQGRKYRTWLVKMKMISKRRDCRLMMCTTVLHRGLYHRTSTPHKSEIKMKDRKQYNKKKYYILTGPCPGFPPPNCCRWGCIVLISSRSHRVLPSYGSHQTSYHSCYRRYRSCCRCITKNTRVIVKPI